MARDGLTVDRLRRFLRQLSPQARALLIAELERTQMRGEEIPGGDFLLDEVRASLREGDGALPRSDEPLRLFFRPLDPFLVSEADRPQPGRIARAALGPIWAWIGRDVLPDETRVYADEVCRSLASGETERAGELAKAMQARAVAGIEQALAAVQADDKARRRLGVQVGSAHGLDDLHEVLTILKARDALAALGARLPDHIRNLTDEQAAAVKSLLDGHAPRGNGGMMLGLVMTMGRLSSPWQVIRLAVKAAETDDIVRISTTPYGGAVPLILGEIERNVSALEADLRRGNGASVISLLKSLHDAVRGLRTEVDLPVDHVLGRRLADIRSEIARVLKSAIESMPGRVRRLLRILPAKEIAPGAMLDASDVADIATLIEVVDACRHYAGELAVSEMTLRTWSELEHYLDTNTKILVESLRNAAASDRPFRQSQVDAAVRFCATVFGKDYAALLRKSADVALNSERRVAAQG